MAWSDVQIAEYNDYLEFLRSTAGAGFPVPKDIADYFTNKDRWMEAMTDAIPWRDHYMGYTNALDLVDRLGEAMEFPEFAQKCKEEGNDRWVLSLFSTEEKNQWGDQYGAYREYLKANDYGYQDGKHHPEALVNFMSYVGMANKWGTDWWETRPWTEIAPEWTTPQKSAFERYQMYANLYGDPDDWYPTDMQNFFDNYDVASEQLDEWGTEASREYRQYQDLSSYREPGDWRAADLDDFVSNWEQAQEQQDVWMGRYNESEAEQQELDEYYESQRQYALDPEEAARRREESYAYTLESRARAREAAAEAYQPDVQYDPAFYKQQEALQGESVYYKNWTLNMYPELRRRFEATQPRPRGYPTRGAARQAASGTEASWENYLGAKQYALRQEFYDQRPTERGERPAYYSPRLRQVSY